MMPATLEEQAPFTTDDLWLRVSAEAVAVHPQRMIEVVVIPYDTPARVIWQGRQVDETIARGAFDGIQRRANRVSANRDHDDRRVVGRAVALHPNRDRGLVADVRISQTPTGDETLTLAADGVLYASAGFRPMDGGMRWDHPDAYTITKAWLGHIAFTPSPAYDGTDVLAVRAAPAVAVVEASATPNLDAYFAQVAADELAVQAASLRIA